MITRKSAWKLIFLTTSRLFPTIFSNISEKQGPSGCVSESVTKMVGTTVVFKNCFQALFALKMKQLLCVRNFWNFLPKNLRRITARLPRVPYRDRSRAVN